MARVLRTRLAIPSLCVLVIVLLCAALANVIAPHDPDRQEYKHVLEKPSPAYLLGTDDLGRDILSRIIFGTRVSVSVGIVAVGIALVGTTRTEPRRSAGPGDGGEPPCPR